MLRVAACTGCPTNIRQSMTRIPMDAPHNQLRPAGSSVTKAWIGKVFPSANRNSTKGILTSSILLHSLLHTALRCSTCLSNSKILDGMMCFLNAWTMINWRGKSFFCKNLITPNQADLLIKHVLWPLFCCKMKYFQMM